MLNPLSISPFAHVLVQLGEVFSELVAVCCGATEKGTEQGSCLIKAGMVTTEICATVAKGPLAK